MEIFDITIVGAGPVGMFAAFYAGIRQAKTKLIDSLPQLGGQLTTLYPEKNIYDIPGFPIVKAADLVNNLEKQLRTFSHTYCLEEEVLELKQHEDYLELITTKDTHYTKSVVLAIGNGSFQPRRLMIADADSVEKLKKSSVNIYTPYILKELHGEQDLEDLTLQKAKSDETITLNVDYLIVNYGFSSSLDHLKSWGLESTRQAILVESDMRTSIPGVYACGDISTYDGKVKLIATGMGEAPTAVNNALHYINPKNRTQPGHSTSLFPQI